MMAIAVINMMMTIDYSPSNHTLSLQTFNQEKKPTTIDMPPIGLGTYKFKKGAGEVTKAVLDALHLGYRHIDTAFIYGGEQTEKEIGKALTEQMSDTTSSSFVPRSEVFLASKQWRSYHGYDLTLECLNKSLRRLQTDYLDLYLIHWPGPAYNTMGRRKDLMEESPKGPFIYAKEGHEKESIKSLRAETWRAMEDSLFEGKCRAIGVSNFTVRHLEALKETARVWPPAVNQIELHPYNPQTELVQYCRKEGIVVQAYASLGGQDCGKKTWNTLGGKLREREEVRAIAEKYGKTPEQVLLRWASQQGFSVIPKSTNIEHLRMNFEAVCDDNGWEAGLSEEDMKVFSELDQSTLEPGQNDNGCKKPNEKARLCWIRDPLKMLDFE